MNEQYDYQIPHDNTLRRDRDIFAGQVEQLKKENKQLKKLLTQIYNDISSDDYGDLYRYFEIKELSDIEIALGSIIGKDTNSG